jgi:iron complex transport system ATP-binding protein
MSLRFSVTASDLVLGYEGFIAMEASSFSVPAGKITAVIGPNGSGKSTLLGAIAGLIEPLAGTLDVPARSGGSRRVSYVLQTTKVNEALPITVGEIVSMGRYSGAGWYQPLESDDRLAVTDAMTRTGVEDLARRHLDELSGGQRQRVFVAQGLAQDHDLLLLDEPLTGIDIAAARAIDKAIHDEIEQGCTVIMTTHDLSEARIADYVVLLAGRVVAAGPPEDVLTGANLGEAYGQSLLHIDQGDVFVDDPAHTPVPGRHIHRDRSIHTESSPTDTHGL